MLDFKEGYIVLENSDKEVILKELALTNTFKQYTYITLKELKKKLTFEILPEALVKVCLKYNFKPEVAKNYLFALSSLNGKFLTDKGLFLKEIYDFLKAENLIKEDNLFKKYAKQIHFTFYGYEDTKELNYVLSMIENYDIVEIKKDEFNKDFKVNTFKEIDQELGYVFSQIFELIKKGISLNKIKLCNVSSEYTFLIKRYERLYNLNINQGFDNNLLQTSFSKDFFDLIKSNSLNEVIQLLTQKYDNDLVNKLIHIINDYGLYNYNPNNIKSVYHMILKELKFTKDVYQDEIECIDLNELVNFKDDYVFLLNFNIDVPRIKKDEEYLTDNDKKILDMDTSNEINIKTKKRFIQSILKMKHVTITFSYMHSFRNAIISPLLKENGFKEEKFSSKYYPIGYEKVSDDLYLASSCDNLLKYNEKNEMLDKYYYKELKYNTFDNSYKVKDMTKITSFLPKPLKLSYTDMNSYLSCPFSYYLKKVLNIDEFEVTLDTVLGNYAHLLLEAFELEQPVFDFEKRSEEIKNEIISQAIESEYHYSEKDEYYLNKMKKNIALVIDVIKEHKNHTRLKQVYCEKKMDVTDSKLIFKGFIDKIWYEKIDDISYVAIIDYKTGNDVASVDDLSLGINLQLPIYIYLLRHNDKLKNAKLVGFYLQKINILNPAKNEKISEIEQKRKNIMLEGYTNPELVDYIDSTETKDYLKKFKLKKDGTHTANSKVFNENDEEKWLAIVEKKIQDCLTGINNGDFKIVSKLIDNKNVSCRFCHFKDVCFKTIKDNLYLESEKQEKKEGVDEDADE